MLLDRVSHPLHQIHDGAAAGQIGSRDVEIEGALASCPWLRVPRP